MPAVNASVRQTQLTQGCLFWLGATQDWHYIKPCGVWQVPAGGSWGADGATRGWAPPEPLRAPHSHGSAEPLSHLHGWQYLGPPWDWFWCPRVDGMGTAPCMSCRVLPCTRCANTTPAVGTTAAPRVMCLPADRLGRAGSRLGTLTPRLQPVRPSCPVPLSSAACPLFGRCSRVAAGRSQLTLAPPDPAHRLGVSGPSPLLLPQACGLPGLLSPLCATCGWDERLQDWNLHPGPLCGWRGLPGPHSSPLPTPVGMWG